MLNYTKYLYLLGKGGINIKTPLSKDYEVFNLNALLCQRETIPFVGGSSYKKR